MARISTGIRGQPLVLLKKLLRPSQPSLPQPRLRSAEGGAGFCKLGLVSGGLVDVRGIGVCHRGARNEKAGEETHLFLNFWNPGGSDQIDLEKPCRSPQRMPREFFLEPKSAPQHFWPPWLHLATQLVRSRSILVGSGQHDTWLAPDPWSLAL